MHWARSRILLILATPGLLLGACRGGFAKWTIGAYYAGIPDSTIHVLKNSGTIDEAYILTDAGVTYGLCVGADGRVDYMFSHDPSFRTDGLRIGDKFATLKAAVARPRAGWEPGWYSYVQLPSGWYAAFKPTDFKVPLDDTASIICFFKR